jgi:predicted Na+-dependent transporter
MKIQVVEKILGNIHREAIPAWTAKIQKVMAKVGEISLLDL